VLSGVFRAVEVEGDKGSGDTTRVDAQTPAYIIAEACF